MLISVCEGISSEAQNPLNSGVLSSQAAPDKTEPRLQIRSAARQMTLTQRLGLVRVPLHLRRVVPGFGPSPAVLGEEPLIESPLLRVDIH